MASFTSLPLLVQIEIARYLNLGEALAFSQTCTLAHDAVYYVFSHRDELDFSSVLDVNGSIALPDDVVLKVLHAHVRATSITSFCLAGTFSMFADLDTYFYTYWRVLVNMHGDIVGHPLGNLTNVWLHQGIGIAYDAPPASRDRLWHKLDRHDEVLGLTETDPSFSYFRHAPYANWSTIDLEERCKPCLYCHFPTLSSRFICQTCTDLYPPCSD